MSPPPPSFNATATVDSEVRIPADLTQLSAARTDATQRVNQRWKGPASRRNDIVLIFAELLTNAIEASPPNGLVEYSLCFGAHGVVIRIVNQNISRSAIELRAMPEPSAVSGRGLALAQDYADMLEIHSAGVVVDIRAHFYFRQGQQY